MFSPALICVCVCLSVCLSVTTITKKIVDGFVPNFMGRFLEGTGRREMSTGQSAVMRCGWGVKAGRFIPFVDKRVGGR